MKAGREEGSQASNGTAEVVNESRVSSMIARLSNGVRPEELNTNAGRQADRKQFLSKFINNKEKQNITETREEIPRDKTEPDLVRTNSAAVEESAAREKAAVFEKEVEDVGQPEVEESNISTNGFDSHHSPVGAAKVYNESSSPHQLR